MSFKMKNTENLFVFLILEEKSGTSTCTICNGGKKAKK